MFMCLRQACGYKVAKQTSAGVRSTKWQRRLGLGLKSNSFGPKTQKVLTPEKAGISLLKESDGLERAWLFDQPSLYPSIA